MAKPTKPEAVNLVCGAIYSPDADIVAVRRRLEETFGPADMESEVFAFDLSDYYEPEMGAGLLKKFFSFEKLIEPETISVIKLATNRIEEGFVFAGTGGRRVNLDPGYVAVSKFVLATTKDYGHRVYLGKGIFAEVTMRFVKGTFIPMEYTYPDHRTEGYIRFLNGVREMYREKLKTQKIKE